MIKVMGKGEREVKSKKLVQEDNDATCLGPRVR